MRKLSILERKAFLKLIRFIADDAARKQAIKDINESYVEKVNQHILTFHIAGYVRPKYEGQHALMSKDSLMIDGIVPDALGEDIYVWPFADQNNRILDIELNNFSDNILFPLDGNKIRLT